MKRKKKTIKNRILAHFKGHEEGFTSKEAARSLKLKYSVVQPRISELNQSDHLIIVGKSQEGNKKNNIYRLNPAPELFGTRRKTKFEMYVEAVRKVTTAQQKTEIERLFKNIRSCNRAN